MSPISSRKSVPPCAAWNCPTRVATAPVKAPFTWPNSSDSRSASGIAPQFTATNGPLGARRAAVDLPRHHLLAGAGLARRRAREMSVAATFSIRR